MNTVNLANATAHLSELIEQAVPGKTSCITRRGKPVALATLRTLTESMPVQTETTGDFVRKMRDGDRY